MHWNDVRVDSVFYRILFRVQWYELREKGALYSNLCSLRIVNFNICYEITGNVEADGIKVPMGTGKEPLFLSPLAFQ